MHQLFSHFLVSGTAAFIATAAIKALNRNQLLS